VTTSLATDTDLTAVSSPTADDPTELLRAEVRAVLDGPRGRRARAMMLAARDFSGETDPRPVYRLLGAHRLLAANWPNRYGGRGLPAAQAAAVVEEMIAAGVSDTLHTLSVQICGTFLLSAGSPAQRAELLPALARGQRFCTVLYTEPAVGSDLSTLATRAQPAPGGGWWLTGRKVYSVRTTLADIALVAARSSEESTPYQGISLFLVPLDTPGVTVATLPSLANEAFGDVTLDGAPVGADAVVGPVGGAWPLITGALALERTGVDHVAKADAWLRGWFAEQTGGPDPLLAAAAGRLRTRVLAARALSRRCVAELDRGRVDPVAAAATKLWCSETAREVATWCAAALHERALWTHRDPDAPAAGRLEAAYREAPGLTISAGTSEMMLELVAGAGLPGKDITPVGEESLVVDLRRAVRAACGPVTERPTQDDPGVVAELAALGVLGLRVPSSLGGTGLGFGAALAACEETGAALCDGTLLDGLTAVDALVASLAHGAAATEDIAGEDVVADLVAGRRSVAMVTPERPDRPVTHPGADGLLLVASGGGLPGADARVGLLSADHPGVTRVRRTTALGDVDVVGLDEAAHAAVEPLCDGPSAETVLAADLLRRAAALIGLGSSCLVSAVRRARGRQQFGRALVDNQSVAFRLAGLATHAQALRALTAWLGARLDEATAVGDPARLGAQAAGALAEAAAFATSAAADAVQLHGAFGLVAGSPVARHYRFAPLAIARGPAPDVLRRHACTDDPTSGGLSR
jgi:alkylation response protein AidB-like acyl-CoA dehydrogenase